MCAICGESFSHAIIKSLCDYDYESPKDIFPFSLGAGFPEMCGHRECIEELQTHKELFNGKDATALLPFLKAQSPLYKAIYNEGGGKEHEK